MLHCFLMFIPGFWPVHVVFCMLVGFLGVGSHTLTLIKAPCLDVWQAPGQLSPAMFSMEFLAHCHFW